MAIILWLGADEADLLANSYYLETRDTFSKIFNYANIGLCVDIQVGEIVLTEIHCCR